MNEDYEERILVEAVQRDPSSFSQLYERNFYRVYAYIARRVKTGTALRFWVLRAGA